MRQAVRRVARGAYLFTCFLLDLATALVVLFVVVLHYGTL
jgi:hypothetical protein